jgi:uncharacterized membrane protein
MFWLRLLKRNKRSMIRIEKEIEIKCPVEEVFAYVADISNHETFCGAFQEIRQLSAGALEVGARVKKVSALLGKEMVAEQEVTAFEPNRLISLQTISGPVAGQEHFLFEKTIDGTRMKLILLAKPPGVLALAAPVLKTKIKNQMATDLDTLKKILESNPKEP